MTSLSDFEIRNIAYGKSNLGDFGFFLPFLDAKTNLLCVVLHHGLLIVFTRKLSRVFANFEPGRKVAGTLRTNKAVISPVSDANEVPRSFDRAEKSEDISAI